jgi:hypothetical protein
MSTTGTKRSYPFTSDDSRRDDTIRRFFSTFELDKSPFTQWMQMDQTRVRIFVGEMLKDALRRPDGFKRYDEMYGVIVETATVVYPTSVPFYHPDIHDSPDMELSRIYRRLRGVEKVSDKKRRSYHRRWQRYTGVEMNVENENQLLVSWLS